MIYGTVNEWILGKIAYPCLVEVVKSRCLDLQCSHCNVIPKILLEYRNTRDRGCPQSLIVNANGKITVVNELMDRQERIVRLRRVRLKGYKWIRIFLIDLHNSFRNLK